MWECFGRNSPSGKSVSTGISSHLDLLWVHVLQSVCWQFSSDGLPHFNSTIRTPLQYVIIAIFTIVGALMEEIGWRGYVLPKILTIDSQRYPLP